MKNRNGFTLIELLAVIAIMGLLALIAVPNIIKLYNKGVVSEMRVQENTIKDAANLFLEDHCNSKLDDDATCPSSYEVSNYNDEKYVCLSDLQASNDDYISKTIKFKKDTCQGVIIYDRDYKTGLYTTPNVYLYCGDSNTGEYNYVTDEGLNPGRYARCNIKVNDDIYYIQLMEEQLSEMHSILQRENELAVMSSNGTNTDSDRESIKKEMLEHISEIEKLYNYEYLNAYILHENNSLTGKYVVRNVSTSGLKLDQLTYSDYKKDIDIIHEAIRTINYFRSYLGAEQNAYEHRDQFKNCKNDNSCQLDEIKSMVGRIYELSYMAAYSDTNTSDDLVSIDLEVQALFKNLDTFSESMKDSSVSKNAIFPNGKNTLTKGNALIVYKDANEYMKKYSSRDDRLYGWVWTDQTSMYETAKGAIREIINITERQDELMTQCANETNTDTDRKYINDELFQLLDEIDRIKETTSFNEIGLLKDKDFYKDYLLYDVSDTNLKNINCLSSSTSAKAISDYMRKMNLNLISLNANINKAEKLSEFIDCFGKSGCAASSTKDVLNSMVEIANSAISATSDSAREEYNIEYTTYFKALSHIAEMSEDNSYSASGLGIENTNVLTVDAANAAKTLLNTKIANIK